MKTMADMTDRGMILTVLVMVFGLFTAIAEGVPANRMEAWDNGLFNGWTDDVYSATLSNPGNYLQLVFPAQSTFMPTEDGIAGGVYASGGAFSGDYVAMGATNVTFSLMTDGHLPATIRVVLRGAASGREWSYSPLVLSDVPGVWVLNNVPLVFSADQWRLGMPGATKEMFLEDLSNVASIGIRIQQNGTSAQIYGFDQFCLHVDTALVETKTADGLPLWWIKKYFGGTSGTGGAGLTSTAADADPDHDGMSNMQEYLAGTNPNDANSVFGVKVENKATGGIALKWPSGYYGQKYAVWRCSDLISGFTVLQGGIDATPPENTYEDATATGVGPYFYKVKVE